MHSWLHLDEIRTLLNLHYDDVHSQLCKQGKRKTKARKSDWKIFERTVTAHRKPLCQRLRLPNTVKTILQRSQDEADLEKLEHLRLAIIDELQGADTVLLETPEQIQAIAAAIKRSSKNEKHVDELTSDCFGVPACSRVRLPEEHKTRAETATAILKLEPNDLLPIWTRPFGTKREPLTDSFGRKLFQTRVRRLVDELQLSPIEIVDKMLVCLWDALFLQQSEKWSAAGVANLNADETPELARYFQKGYRVGSKPIFDGMCSMCGCLLFGPLDNNSSLSNKTSGPPINRSGMILQDDKGALCVDAQPPFLLRFSPALFAKEAPEMFQHDPDTNRLSLKEGKHPPWLKKLSGRTKHANPWLYCVDCKDQWFKTSSNRRGHIPYRDRASQAWMRPVHKGDPLPDKDSQHTDDVEDAPPSPDEDEEMPPLCQPCESGSNDGAFMTSAAAEAALNPALENEDVDDDDDIMEPGSADERPAMDVDKDKDLPQVRRPTDEEYKEKWARLEAHYSRPVPGEFSRANLVPESVTQLWQDCPHVPFDKLKSIDAISRLSHCRPLSGFTPAHTADGVTRYAHNSGEVNWVKRHPLQLASTFGFMVNTRDGYFPGMNEEEKAALHECFAFQRQHGNNPVCFFGAEFEDFDGCCKALMDKAKQLLPEGCARTRIRAFTRGKSANDGTLADTLGNEARGLVVLDFDGHPHTYDQTQVLGDTVAKELTVTFKSVAAQTLHP